MNNFSLSNFLDEQQQQQDWMHRGGAQLGGMSRMSGAWPQLARMFGGLRMPALPQQAQQQGLGLGVGARNLSELLPGFSEGAPGLGGSVPPGLAGLLQKTGGG